MKNSKLAQAPSEDGAPKDNKKLWLKLVGMFLRQGGGGGQ